MDSRRGGHQAAYRTTHAGTSGADNPHSVRERLSEAI